MSLEVIYEAVLSNKTSSKTQISLAAIKFSKIFKKFKKSFNTNFKHCIYCLFDETKRIISINIYVSAVRSFWKLIMWGNNYKLWFFARLAKWMSHWSSNRYCIAQFNAMIKGNLVYVGTVCEDAHFQTNLIHINELWKSFFFHQKPIWVGDLNWFADETE